MEDEKRLNAKRMNVEGKWQMINILCDINYILPKELQLKPNEYFILSEIWSHSDNNYISIISNQTIANYTGISLRTVERIVPQLVEKGWLINLSNRYHNSKVRKLVVPEYVKELIELNLNETDNLSD